MNLCLEPTYGPARPTKRVPGYAAGDLNTTGLNSVKGLRMSASAGVVVNVKTRVGLCSGYVDPASPALEATNVAPLGKVSNADKRRNRKYAAAIAAGKTRAEALKLAR